MLPSVSVLLCLVLISKTLFSALGASNNSEIEQKLETEFDLREPRSFQATNKEYLVVRINGFNKMSHYTPDGRFINTDDIPNWEKFSLGYWFETRTPYSSCDMEPSGISTQFDWTFTVPCMFGDPNKAPSTIFVVSYMLPHFIESTLHFMNPTYRFVLVSGASDMTVPRSSGDSRYHVMRGFSAGGDGGSYFQKLVNDPRLIHWYAENHDLNHAKLSTLPTGLVSEVHDDVVKNMPAVITPFSERPLKILVADRVRTGRGQWFTRARVVELCDQLPEFCQRPSGSMTDGVGHGEFVKLMSSVPFIACAHGGGMDPSPKAWEAIMAGTIPIIQHSTLDDAYAKLPVAFVDNWEQLLLPANHSAMEDLLRGWIKKLQPYYETGSHLRAKTLDKLKTAYWVDQIYRKVRDYHRLEAELRPTNTTTDSKATEGTKTSETLSTAGKYAPSSPPVAAPTTAVPLSDTGAGAVTDDFDAQFDAETSAAVDAAAPSPVVPATKAPAADTSGVNADSELKSKPRALMRRKEDTASPHAEQAKQAERGRVVRALRASAIARAKEEGIWHSNPAAGTSPPSAKRKTTTRHV